MRYQARVYIAYFTNQPPADSLQTSTAIKMHPRTSSKYHSLPKRDQQPAPVASAQPLAPLSPVPRCHLPLGDQRTMCSVVHQASLFLSDMSAFLLPSPSFLSFLHPSFQTLRLSYSFGRWWQNLELKILLPQAPEYWDPGMAMLTD